MINKEQHVFSLKFGIGSTCGWHKLNCTWLPFMQFFTCAISSKLHVKPCCYLCIPHLTVLTCKSVLSHKLIGFICLHFNTLYRFVGHVLSKFNPLFILWICLLKWIRRWYCLLLLVKDGECESFEHQINLNARMLEWKVKSRIYQTVKRCANFGIPKKWQLYITLGLC